MFEKNESDDFNFNEKQRKCINIQNSHRFATISEMDKFIEKVNDLILTMNCLDYFENRNCMHLQKANKIFLANFDFKFSPFPFLNI